jgi:glycosyltransferase involved in cell wall biosynthesis
LKDSSLAKDANILHIAGWYPGPWNRIEGSFVQDHIRIFRKEAGGSAIVVQVRHAPDVTFDLEMRQLSDGVRGYYLLTKASPGRLTEVLCTLLLLFALVRSRAWRFSALHFHIAYPALMHVRWWRWMFRRPILISEHWSAYHYNFSLPEGSRALASMRRPFRLGFPVLAVSESLLRDIRDFAQDPDLQGYVVPNCVPLHGPSEPGNNVPVLFCVNHWVEIKDPMPMLEGLARARGEGADFELVIGGFGELLPRMQEFVAGSPLASCTQFAGEMTKGEIARKLARADGFVFNSRYETFSVAAAEALGAGVPLVGPYIPAIAEYASSDDWQIVAPRGAEGWAQAASIFLQRVSAGGFDRRAIAERAAVRFSEEALRSAYRYALECSLPRTTQRDGARVR